MYHVCMCVPCEALRLVVGSCMISIHTSCSIYIYIYIYTEWYSLYTRNEKSKGRCTRGRIDCGAAKGSIALPIMLWRRKEIP